MSRFSWLFGSSPAAGDARSPPPPENPAARQLSSSATATDSRQPIASTAAMTTPRIATESPAAAANSQALGIEASPSSQSTFFSPRSIKQLGLFFAGAGFLTASILISRRAAIRHHRTSQLKYYHPNYKSAKTGDATERRDPMVAVEALNLATLNVMSFALMAGAGTAWALDISSIEDLRERARRSLYGPGGRADEDAEKEVAEWMAKTLGRKVDIEIDPNQNDKKGSGSRS